MLFRSLISISITIHFQKLIIALSNSAFTEYILFLRKLTFVIERILPQLPRVIFLDSNPDVDRCSTFCIQSRRGWYFFEPIIIWSGCLTNLCE